MLMLMKKREEKQIKGPSKAPKDLDDSEYGDEDFSDSDSDSDSYNDQKDDGANLFGDDFGKDDEKQAETGGDMAMDDDVDASKKTGK